MLKKFLQGLSRLSEYVAVWRVQKFGFSKWELGKIEEWERENL